MGTTECIVHPDSEQRKKSQQGEVQNEHGHAWSVVGCVATASGGCGSGW